MLEGVDKKERAYWEKAHKELYENEEYLEYSSPFLFRGFGGICNRSCWQSANPIIGLPKNPNDP
jgi:hypothetical protein